MPKSLKNRSHINSNNSGNDASLVNDFRKGINLTENHHKKYHSNHHNNTNNDYQGKKQHNNSYQKDNRTNNRSYNYPPSNYYNHYNPKEYTSHQSNTFFFTIDPEEKTLNNVHYEYQYIDEELQEHFLLINETSNNFLECNANEIAQLNAKLRKKATEEWLKSKSPEERQQYLSQNKTLL
jgi:hypothetical protein